MPTTVPFDCRIKFTGLCAFVPNKPLEQAPNKMCVVLVDATDKPTNPVRALDGTPLRRHRAYVLFNLKNYAGFTGKPTGEAKGVWYLQNQRVSLDLIGGQTFDTNYLKSADDKHDINVIDPVEEENFAWVAGMTKMAAKFPAMDPLAVTTTPPQSVLAQILLTKGSLRVNRPERQVWCFPKVLSGDVIRRPIAHEAILELTGLTQLILQADALPGGASDSLELKPPVPGQRVEITVANLCEDNPLLWPKPPAPKDDDDFKWYYQLLTGTDQANVNRERRGLALPAPLVERTSSGPNATGVNCFPVRFADIPF